MNDINILSFEEKLEETVEPELLCGNCPGKLDCVNTSSGLKYPGCFSAQFQAYRTEKELDELIELVKNGFKLVYCEEYKVKIPNKNMGIIYLK